MEVKARWTVDPIPDMRMNLPSVASAHKRALEVTTFHQSYSRNTPRLSALLGNLRNYRIIERTYNGVKTIFGYRIRLNHPGARLQNDGGTIPARKAVRGKFMTYFAYGRWWRMKKVGPSVIKAKRYIELGVEMVALEFKAGAFQLTWRKK